MNHCNMSFYATYINFLIIITFFPYRCQMNRKKEVKCPGTAYLDVYKKEIESKLPHCHEPVHNDFETFNSNSASDSNLVINQSVSDNLEIGGVIELVDQETSVIPVPLPRKRRVAIDPGAIDSIPVPTKRTKFITNQLQCDIEESSDTISETGTSVFLR